MSVFMFEVPNQPGKDRVFVGWQGMTWSRGVRVLHSNESLKDLGEIEIKNVCRAKLLASITPEELKAGKILQVEGLGEVRIGIKKILLGLVQSITIDCGGVPCKGHELIHYRGVGVV